MAKHTTPEFRRESARLVVEGGVSLDAVATGVVAKLVLHFGSSSSHTDRDGSGPQLSWLKRNGQALNAEGQEAVTMVPLGLMEKVHGCGLCHRDRTSRVV
jgi:hypothetical protein